MGKSIISGGAVMTVPTVLPALSTIAEGSIVKLNENGIPVEFYVAKHDYESGLNGAGRTLLVRRHCYDERIMDNGDVWGYENSEIDSWLNGTYKGLLDTTIQNAISKTNIYFTNTSFTLSQVSRSVFLLSLAELDGAEWYEDAPDDGEALPVANTLQVAYLNGSAVNQWTRTSYGDMGGYVFGADGSVLMHYWDKENGSRPCFTLPATALVQTDGAIKI